LRLRGENRELRPPAILAIDLGSRAEGAAAVNLAFTLTDEQLAEIARQVAPLVLAGSADRGEPSPWLSLADAAAYLSVSERTIERAVARGNLRSSTLGRRRLLHRNELDRFARAAGEE
jgi:excisionase family DNA binding protein